MGEQWIYGEEYGEIYICRSGTLGTRWARNTRFKEEVDPMCRVCGKQFETVNHLASGCVELAKKQYVRRHDRMGVRIYWELCTKHGIGCTERWYEHVPNRVSTARCSGGG